MGKRIYVGNLGRAMRGEDLHKWFCEFGKVASAKVMIDGDTGRSRGFGFVEMASEADARAAIQALNGRLLEGCALVVNDARVSAPGRPL